MFIVFDCKNAPYLKTWDEVEADTTAAQIGGYYVKSGAYQNGGRCGSLYLSEGQKGSKKYESKRFS